MTVPVRILNLEPDRYSPEASRLLREFADVDDGPLSRSALLERIGNYDAVIVRFAHRIDREVIAAGGKLRAIACAATGTDHIDIETAQERAISIVSLAGETAFLRRIPASAEHSWGLLLALMRRIPWAAELARRGEWTRDAFRGRDLAGRTLGIVGCGRIGERVAIYGQAFGMDVQAFDPYRPKLPDGVVRADTLPALMKASDAIMVHVPLKPETVGLIGEDMLALVKPGSVLVNTARGAIVDENALLAALKSNRLSGAALDVLTDENPDHVGNGPLIVYAQHADNLIVTPHIGGATDNSMSATEIFIAKKLQDLLAARSGAKASTPDNVAARLS